MPRKNLTDKVFGRLTALSPTDKKRWGSTVWRCVCDCGKEKLVTVNDLCKGSVQSCGCLQKEKSSIRNTKHGHYKAKNKSSTYKSWDAMIQRCSNPNNTNYKNYGAKGISICKQWLVFENFLADMGERPSGCSIDRIDYNGNYEPSNCRWATALTQARNTRRVKLNLKTAREIRKLYSQGNTPKQIELILGVTRALVTSVVYLGNWAELDSFSELVND